MALPQEVAAGLQRMSEALETIETSFDAGGVATITSSRVKPIEFAGAPFASGVPTVMKLEL